VKDIKGKLKKEKRVYLIMGKMVGGMKTETREFRVVCEKCESPSLPRSTLLESLHSFHIHS